MMSTATRALLVGCAFTVVGVLLLAAGAWLGSDPLATQFRSLLTGGLCLASGLSCLVAAYRRMRLGGADAKPLQPAPPTREPAR
jgi:hypothetical protein